MGDFKPLLKLFGWINLAVVGFIVVNIFFDGNMEKTSCFALGVGFIIGSFCMR